MVTCSSGSIWGGMGGERGIKVCREGVGQGRAPQNLAPPLPDSIPSPEGSGQLRKTQCCSRMNGPDSLMSTSTWPTLEEGQIGGGPRGRGGPEGVQGCHSPPLTWSRHP